MRKYCGALWCNWCSGCEIKIQSGLRESSGSDEMRNLKSLTGMEERGRSWVEENGSEKKRKKKGMKIGGGEGL